MIKEVIDTGEVLKRYKRENPEVVVLDKTRFGEYRAIMKKKEIVKRNKDIIKFIKKTKSKLGASKKFKLSNETIRRIIANAGYDTEREIFHKLKLKELNKS